MPKTNSSLLVLITLFALTFAGDMWFDYRSFDFSQRGDFREIELSCSGGSGNYLWDYSDLPRGWTYNTNILIIPVVNFSADQYYGFKISVTDRIFGSSLSKSIYISFESTGIEDVFDSAYTDDITNTSFFESMIVKR